VDTAVSFFNKYAQVKGLSTIYTVVYADGVDAVYVREQLGFGPVTIPERAIGEWQGFSRQIELLSELQVNVTVLED
jgi:hypothetical protein